tara:strand:+ start:155 stop:472 length:318 start_codon:yes stop_codon:yes gene_type:complete
MEFKKANKVTAISAVFIVLVSAIAIVNSKIDDQQQQQRATEFQQSQKFNAANTFCREEASSGMYRRARELGLIKDAKEFLMECMEKNGFWNVECSSYGKCKRMGK